jgi:hypothetical protein
MPGEWLRRLVDAGELGADEALSVVLRVGEQRTESTPVTEGATTSSEKVRRLSNGKYEVQVSQANGLKVRVGRNGRVSRNDAIDLLIKVAKAVGQPEHANRKMAGTIFQSLVDDEASEDNDGDSDSGNGGRMDSVSVRWMLEKMADAFDDIDLDVLDGLP